MKYVFHALVILIATFLMLGCESNQDHLGNAQQLLDKPDYAGAVIELKNALQENTNNLQARALLGRVYFEMGKPQDADKELSIALEGGVSEAIVTPVLAQVLLSLGEHDRLKSLSTEGLSPEDLSTVRAAKASSILVQGNFTDASALLEEVLNNDPVSPYALVTGARLAMIQRDDRKARQLLDKAFSINPDYMPAWSYLGDIESQQGNFEQASEAYTRSIELATDSFNERLKRATARFYAKDYPGAQEDVDVLKEALPNHPGAVLTQGLLYLQAEHIEAAVADFERAARFGDAYPQSYYYLAMVQRHQGDLLQAKNNINQFLATSPENASGIKLAAGIAMELGEYSQAEELLDPLVAFFPEDITAQNLLANALLAQGKKEEGIEILTTIAQMQPESPQAQGRLGAGLISIGVEAQGIEALQGALKIDPQYHQADITLTLTYLQQENFEAALATAEDFRNRSPENPTPYNLLGRVYMATDNAEKARASFEKANELAPGDPLANQQLAEMALLDKDFPAAFNYYQRAIKAHPNQTSTLVKLAAAQLMAGDQQAMVATLQKAVRVDPEAMKPKLVLASYYAGQGEPDRAQVLLDSLTNNQKKRPDALLVIATSLLAQNQYNQALIPLDTLISMQPDEAHYHYLKAEAYHGLDNVPGARAELQRVVELFPDHFYARMAIARLAVLSNEPEQFQQQLTELRKISPDNPHVLQLEVAAALMENKPKRAVAILERMFKEKPTTATMIPLALQKQAMGDTEGAIALCTSWISDHNKDIKAREALASFYVQNKQPVKAGKQYARILKIDPDNLTALNNQAWLLQDKEPAEALRLAQRAHELSPESASILDTMATILMKSNNVSEARSAINQALILAPDRPGLLLQDARIKIAEGDKQGAISTLTVLVESDVRFAGRKEAEKLLEQLL
jgi:putative PEP-CTERM system TPR-repeat lipoprotein